MFLIHFFWKSLILRWKRSTSDAVISLFVLFAGYHDTGEYWRSWYESPTFESDLQKLLEELKPLYSNLHAYVREKLINLYGRDKFPTSGQIPAHILGKLRINVFMFLK